MRILFLANASSIHTVRWVNAMIELGHEVHLAFNKGHGPRENKIGDDVFLHELKLSGVLGYYLNFIELRTLFIKINPDVVNAHYASGYGTLARFSKIKPLVLSVWGSDVYLFPFKNKINMTIIKKNLKYADAIGSTSFSMAEQVKKIIHNNETNITITPFGIDLDKFDVHKYTKSDKDKITIGLIKSFEASYDVETLINAISLLRSEMEDIEGFDFSEKIDVKIYGDGSQKKNIAIMIEKLKLNNVISLYNRIPHEIVPKTLADIDIFCITSVNESFGVSAIEAMAMGIPVVATDADGLKEVINNNETGFVVEKSNPQSVSDALKKLIMSEETRCEMGKKAILRVQKLYDWNKSVMIMEDLYKSLLENRI